jgi:hypothetical protein
LASELGDMTSCTKSGFDSKPKPSGTEIDTAGRASSVLDITAVARLRREIDRELIAERVREQKTAKQTLHFTRYKQVADVHRSEWILALSGNLLKVIHHTDTTKLFVLLGSEHILDGIIFANLCCF